MPQPTDIKLRTRSRILEVRFDDGSHFELPFEYLRVFSPSAEVTGHGVGEGMLQTGKEDVAHHRHRAGGQLRAAPAFRRRPQHGALFVDACCTSSACSRDANWARYLERCAAAGVKRKARDRALRFGSTMRPHQARARSAMKTSDRTVDFGFEKVPSAQKAERVRAVFSSVAGKYDLMNDLMSFGAHRLWKRFTLSLTGSEARPARARRRRRHRRSGRRARCARWARPGRWCCRTSTRSMLEAGRDRLLDAGLRRQRRMRASPMPSVCPSPMTPSIASRSGSDCAT